MVRLADLPEWERAHLLEKVPTLPRFDTSPWVRGKPLRKRRLALVTTAGLHLRSDRPFSHESHNEYRVIPGDVAAADLVMSQFSVNFDRSGFQRDVNVVFPIDRARELAGLLKQDAVDAVLLTPV